jgi:flagella basal body P-ring formation protein FlgA
VQPGDLGPETLVRRNAVVTMLYSAGGLAIRTEGRALDAGGEGERVRVMNLSSRQAVPAVVRARDLVEVIR